jgi:RNA polymerase sigma-70 factor (ECF subfamily)
MRRVYFSSDSDDLALVRQSLAGQTEAFGALVTRYQRVMYTVALRMLGNAEDAQDATQDAFIKAYQRLASFDPSYRFYSWMYRILVNECLNVNRGRRSEQPLDDDAAGDGTPFDNALAAERRDQINLALLQLTPEYRTVVVLRHFAGQSYGEIAEALAIPEKTVKDLFRAPASRRAVAGWRERGKDEDRDIRPELEALLQGALDNTLTVEERAESRGFSVRVRKRANAPRSLARSPA